jgi:hypothetical protein
MLDRPVINAGPLVALSLLDQIDLLLASPGQPIAAARQ